MNLWEAQRAVLKIAGLFDAGYERLNGVGCVGNTAVFEGYDAGKQFGLRITGTVWSVDFAWEAGTSRLYLSLTTGAHSQEGLLLLQFLGTGEEPDQRWMIVDDDLPKDSPARNLRGCLIISR